MVIGISIACRFLSSTAVATTVGTLLAVSLMAQPAFAQNGCDTGANALANAYVRGNPMYAIYFGDLRSYIIDNREHFVSNGDSIRCARVMAGVLTNAAVQTYDPDALRSRDELNARLGSMGISPAWQKSTAWPIERIRHRPSRPEKRPR